MPPDPFWIRHALLKHAWLYFVQPLVPYHNQRASAAPTAEPLHLSIFIACMPLGSALNTVSAHDWCFKSEWTDQMVANSLGSLTNVRLLLMSLLSTLKSVEN